MIKIQILGPGCSKCNKLAQRTEEAVKDLGIEYELEKVTAIDRIMQYDVMVTPALVVDGNVKFSGKVPSVDEIKKHLS
jgi:small redox-active disulfide protein 2